MSSEIVEKDHQNERIPSSSRTSGASWQPTARSSMPLSQQIIFVSCLIGGIVCLALAIIYTNNVLTNFGLGLILLGAIYFYMTPHQTIAASLLNSITLSALSGVEQSLHVLNITGKAIYLPLKYREDIPSDTTFIPRKGEGLASSVNNLRAGNFRDLDGVFLTPPGLELKNLFEQEIHGSFDKMKLYEVVHRLPRLLRELEIADQITISLQNSQKEIEVRVEKGIYLELYHKISSLQQVISSFGCPFSSSIALILAQSTQKAVIIQDSRMLEESETLQIRYSLLEVTTQV